LGDELGSWNAFFIAWRRGQSTVALCRKQLEAMEEQPSDNYTILSLPEEVLIDIFGHLRQKELAFVASVCKQW